MTTDTRVLVAGATGAIGRVLCRLLVADGWHVVGTTHKAEAAANLEASGVEPAVVDVFDADALRTAVLGARPTAVIHQLTDLPRQLDAEALKKGRGIQRTGFGGASVIAYSRDVSIQHLQSRSFSSVTSRLLVCVFLFCAVGCSAPAGGPGNSKVPAGAKSSGGLHGVIETDKGPIEIEFLPADAPRAVENFRLLAEHGYYDGLTFHRIIEGFMIQGGDPSGDGSGGESAWGGTFEDEIKPDSPLYRDGYRRGFMAMANAGPNTNGSQFFIMHQDYSALPPNYVIFARVTKGMEAVDALADTPTRLGADGGMSQPLTPPRIKTVTIKP